MQNDKKTLLATLFGVDNETADAIQLLWNKGWIVRFNEKFDCVAIVRGEKNEKISA